MAMAYSTIAVFGAALVATLVLAALLTPAGWWRRPNLRALAFVGLGTWGIGMLILSLVQQPALAASVVSPVLSPVHAAGLRYRVADDLNLRSAKGTDAPRLAVVPAGSTVTATGARDGDWWRLRAEVDGKAVEGWSSSLWLRRADEQAGR
jgi:hypothetical protein